MLGRQNPSVRSWLQVRAGYVCAQEKREWTAGRECIGEKPHGRADIPKTAHLASSRRKQRQPANPGNGRQRKARSQQGADESDPAGLSSPRKKTEFISIFSEGSGV